LAKAFGRFPEREKVLPQRGPGLRRLSPADRSGESAGAQLPGVHDRDGSTICSSDAFFLGIFGLLASSGWLILALYIEANVS
jgi:hypothetical protein